MWSEENMHKELQQKLSDANSSTFEDESKEGKTEPGTEKEEMEEPGLQPPRPPAFVCPCLN